MSTVTSLPSSELLASMNPAKQSTASTQQSQDRFMKLLVTQMKNQDPLNPMDNAQVTSQMAQLSTVSGIEKLNDTVQALMASSQSSQSLQAASMIGHGVLVPGNSMQLVEGKALFGVDLPEPADSVQLSIMDAAGNTVRTMNLGAQGAGSMTLGWDGLTNAGGTAADGQYQMQVSALRGGQKIEAGTLAFGEVSSISMSKQGVLLNLSGALPNATMADVRQIL